ncbi:MAG: hypothetical protein COU35_03930 [Candidatus Magasanikbacteria bacterium CG10_big_fil_rev_8_21_14_0_10_47_10]|uniref:CDP-glycerol--glycerophosphate glycerophosphotransferase n=1 Tax=Candidatus Magasanikbacteria bacterium CG10_big_fil_rev_8_21_14_0_10_47_10 TaxID=1974652 RepID=A0A2H0TPU3_9BACT|nr:MAG: hypothetical protein COU35_03930 [Candidatus Magasanikbacteria bacterium CG10_big_fil_rev_8_21_14_0_10_47_10]
MEELLKKIWIRLYNIGVRLCEVPHIVVINGAIVKARMRKHPVYVVETTTTNEFFYIYNVMMRVHEDGALVVYTSNAAVGGPLRALIRKDFGPPLPKWANVVWTNWLFGVDFYVNATLSYDIHVHKRARYKINFPHTITSKTKYDVFSPAIERMTDTIITGPAYEKDFLAYCADHAIEAIPMIHRLGGPKSDDLFRKTVDKKALFERIGLNPDLPTVFYAPTWNQHTSIFTWLEDILTIPDRHNVNLIIKVHPGAYIDPSNKKSSGAVDWEEFFKEENLRAKRIYNLMNQDSTEYVMASDIAMTCISTIWIEYYLLGKPMIFLDIPKFFETHEMNSLGDFRDEYGYLVKDLQDLDTHIDGLIRGSIKRRDAPALHDQLLFNRGNATDETVALFKQMYLNHT